MTGVHTSEGDAFAIAMLAVMICGMGVVTLILVTILRNASKQNSEVDDLIEEAKEEESRGKTPAGKQKEPWEKDGDWWKK